MADQKEPLYFFFYLKESPFSQFHPCTFVVDGIKYNCAEQYMMYSKAVLFGDENMQKQILSSSDPRTHKSCGRVVKNFDKDIWDAECETVVRKGNLAKFEQNEHLKKELFKTFPKTLVEASPSDTIWGIGLSATNPKALDRKTWRGQNKLGFILTAVRDELMKQQSTS